MRDTILKAGAAAVVGAVTTWDHHRVFTESCEALATTLPQRLIVLAPFAILYGLVAYGLLAVAFRRSETPKSWSELGLRILLSFAFAGFVLASVLLAAEFTQHIIADRTPLGMFASAIASHPSVLGSSILGAAAFLVSCMTAQELSVSRDPLTARNARNRPDPAGEA
jgi:hypothetical protein